MTSRRKSRAFAAVLGASAAALAMSSIAAATTAPPDSEPAGSAPADSEAAGTEAAAASLPPGAGGGEVIDLSTFALGAPDNLDPALNQTLDAYQVINAMYDGLTDIDISDPDNPQIVPLAAESYEVNDDATVWTFTIREGLTFADGEEILPSTFKRSWDRAASPEMGGTYQYIMYLIDGAREVIEGGADPDGSGPEEAPADAPTEISGVVADDEAMTLTVTMDQPYSNFDAVAGFQIFFPMPEAAFENPVDYENSLMVGNGPYTMETPRSDQEVALVRNDAWAGDASGNTWDSRPDRLVFQVSTDAETSYSALEAGEADTARIPSGRTADARENWGTTTETAQLAAYYFQFDLRDPNIGGPDNKLLRQAISQAIDREAINDAVFDGARQIATGVTPPGIPGFEEGLCDYCAFDPEAAQAAFDEWVAAGNSQSEPITVQYGSGGVHGDVVQLIIDNLSDIGIEAEPEELDTTTYFDQMTDGGCNFCRTGWIADYPTYDNFEYDLFHGDSLGTGNNFGYENPEFDALVNEGKSTVDPDARAALFRQAEELMLNTDIGAVPLLWYVGDYAFNQERLGNFVQNPLGLILWEQIVVTE